MSNQAREIASVVRAQATSDGAGVRLMRTIGSHALDHLDPFLLLDEFKSDDANDYIAGFPDHPHRGFETVTYMLAGHMEHRDHLGNQGDLEAGSVQWMTAGRGIVHSEMPRQEHGLMWGFQLWVNLPAKDKMCPPRYQDIPAVEVPEVALGESGVVRVIAGEFAGQRGPVSGIAVDPMYLDARLRPSARHTFALPASHNGFAYVYEGEGSFGARGDRPGTRLRPGQLGILGPGEAFEVQANEPGVRFLIVAGKPIAEPIVRHGPFVMNTREQIMQAVRDYQAGRFG